MIRNSQRVLIHGSLPGDGSFRARATQRARVTQTVSGYFMEIIYVNYMHKREQNICRVWIVFPRDILHA